MLPATSKSPAAKLQQGLGNGRRKPFSDPDDIVWKQSGAQADAINYEDGVMDIVVGLLLLASTAVFAAHALDALRAG